ncbi:RNA-guided endonuclease InsQ/TnpB family protein [Streptomyces sp. NPDC007901]|uniref:RNA-guided endonuclease InsQ/TnpB family protein n=1 Tax=Streptomyces sp. NPDC007901 TaxID=3364785 RepID=UPI0036E01A84
MQLRYAFRLYPDAGQRTALARAFGCARVVFNDTVRAREDARQAGRPFPTAGELSRKLVTEAKRTAARSWLGEVSAVILQQALRDAERAYRNFFASLKGARQGPKVGAPRFKSRKDARQSVRFTANARWTLVKIGRFGPTSRTCSTCGAKDGPKPLNVREWTCSACGTVHDRDHNAAINVKQPAGLAASACGAPVRPGEIPAQREETGSHGLPTEPRAA